MGATIAALAALAVRCRCVGGTLAFKLPHYPTLTTVKVRQYLTSMKTSVSTKGQIVLPAEIRRQDDIEPGQEFDVQRIERGEYRLVRRAPRPNEGVVAWLLDCPDKGFFVRIESESTDTL